MSDIINPEIKIILTGATGMVGEGVLHECLQRSEVEHVLVINRNPCGVIHPKLKEIIHADFFKIFLQPAGFRISHDKCCNNRVRKKYFRSRRYY